MIISTLRNIHHLAQSAAAYYNGEADQVEGFRHFLQHVQAPTCLSEVGFPLSDQHFEQLCSALVSSEYVAQDAASRARFAQAMALIAH